MKARRCQSALPFSKLSSPRSACPCPCSFHLLPLSLHHITTHTTPRISVYPYIPHILSYPFTMLARRATQVAVCPALSSHSLCHAFLKADWPYPTFYYRESQLLLRAGGLSLHPSSQRGVRSFTQITLSFLAHTHYYLSLSLYLLSLGSPSLPPC